MTREEHLSFCSVCTNRSFNPKHGIICGITQQLADFSGTCEQYTEDPKEKRIETQKVEQLKTGTNKEINKGRYALFLIGALYIIVGFYEAFMMVGHDLLFGIIDWGAAIVFIGLGFWSYKQASLPLIIGLCFYILIILLLALLEPISIVKGIIWKVLIIYYLIVAIKTARTEEAKKQTLPVDLLDQL